MSKKFILTSCIISALLSTAAITTVFVLIPIKKNFINSKNLKITPYSGLNNVSQNDLDAMISVTNLPEERIFSLSKLFDGLTEDNLNNIIVEGTSNSSVILNAKNDYFFNSIKIKSLTSNYNIVEVIDITAKEGIINISQDEINVIFSSSNSIADKVVVLSKLFDGVTEANFPNFGIEKSSDTEIILIANEGFAFGLDTLSTIKTDIEVDSILNITPKEGTINVTNEDIVAMISVQNTPEKLAALSKLFDGINDKNIINITAEKTSNTVITLKAQNGFTFGSTTITEITVNVKIVTVLNIKLKATIDNITDADVQEMISTTNTPAQRATALLKLFDGVTESNVINFTVEKTSDKEITLKAKEGYAFGLETLPSIKADIKVVTVLNIKPKTEIINVTNADIVAMISLTNIPAKVTALSKIFEGVNETNAPNFIAEKTSDTVITLKANNGFSFGNTSTTSITAKINIVLILNITPKNVTSNITDADIAEMISTTNTPAQRAAALSKLFDGVNETNVINFTVEKPSSTVILLKANQGYAFNDLLLDSIGADVNKVITVLNIKAKSGTINISQADLDAITSTTNQAKDRVAALLNLFDGVTEENLNNFKIVKNPNSITLTANDGFALGSIITTSITTNFKIITILNILAKPGTNNVTEADILAMVSLSDPDKRITALAKLFTGITKDNVNNIKVEKTSNTEITLIANDGFAFNSIEIFSIKADIRIVALLNMSPKPNVIDVTEADIAIMVSTANSLQDRVTALSKVFDGVTVSNVANVRAEKTSNTKITLNANGNYVFDFNSSSSIQTNIRIITILPITAKTETINITQSDIDVMTSISNPVADRTEALLKLFNGVTVSNVVNVRAVKTSNTQITLNANEGFGFGTIENKALIVNIKIITVLNINPISGINQATQDDINKMISTTNSPRERAAALSRLFNGINEGNVIHIKVGQPNNAEISLTANEGYAFNSITTISIKSSYRLIRLLHVSPKPGTNKISEADYNTIFQSNNPDAKAKSLSILFNGIDGHDIDQNRYRFNASQNVFTLTANEGYAFGSIGNLTVQSTFQRITILNITAKTGPIGISQTESAIVSAASSSMDAKLPILQKLFNGVNTSNYNFFDVKNRPQSKIGLETKIGYGFVTATNTLIEVSVFINGFKYDNKNPEIFYNLSNINEKKKIIK
ncbi:MAG: hypothetical protein ACRC9U_02030 [Metamycoplasmataceae bacterium]